MSGQGSRVSAGEYQADEQAGVAGLSWRVIGIALMTSSVAGVMMVVTYSASKFISLSISPLTSEINSAEQMPMMINTMILREAL